MNSFLFKNITFIIILITRVTIYWLVVWNADYENFLLMGRESIALLHTSSIWFIRTQNIIFMDNFQSNRISGFLQARIIGTLLYNGNLKKNWNNCWPHLCYYAIDNLMLSVLQVSTNATWYTLYGNDGCSCSYRAEVILLLNDNNIPS